MELKLKIRKLLLINSISLNRTFYGIETLYRDHPEN